MTIAPLAFREALDYAAQRKVILPAQYYGSRIGLQRAQAFSVAGLTQVSQIQLVLDSLNDHLKDGLGFEAWKEQVTSGNISLDLPAERLDNIFRTNIQGSYNAGRYAQQTDPVNLKLRPFWMYDAVNDSRTRPTHRAMDNTILPADDRWWTTHYPPNGYRCRCTVLSLSAKQAQQRGIAQTYPQGAEPDSGWGYNPGQAYQQGVGAGLDKAVKDNPDLDDAVRDIKDDAEAKQPTLADVKEHGSQVVRELLADPQLQRTAKEAAADTGMHAALRIGFQTALRERWGESAVKPAEVLSGPAATGDAATGAFERMPPSFQRAMKAHYGRLINNRTSNKLLVKKTANRASFNPQFQTMTTDGSLDTTIHEMAHAVQWAAPQIDALFQEYHAERTAGEALVKLKQLRPTTNYCADEVTKPDKFIEPYMGKVYQKSTSGYGGPLEMMSMAMEYLMGNSTAKFMRLFTQDRSFFDMIVGVTTSDLA